MGWIPATTGGATAAAAAAAEERRREEEEMTGYTQEELENDWEFKIVRSEFLRAFGNPEKMQRLIEEEARAGWVMIEKFDNTRVRFKRPRSARERDHLLGPGIDPYRTQYDRLGSSTVAVLIGLVVAGLLALGVFAMFALR